MMHRLGVLMLVVAVALATVAHDWCRLTCANATHRAIVSESASATHAHCAQSDNDAHGLAVSAAMPPCQIDSDITPATVALKIAMLVPIAMPAIIVAPLGSHIATPSRSASPPSYARSSLIPLRI